MYPDFNRILNPVNTPVTLAGERGFDAPVDAPTRSANVVRAQMDATDNPALTRRQVGHGQMATSNAASLTQPASVPQRPVRHVAMVPHKVAYNAGRLDVTIDGRSDRQSEIAKLVHTLNEVQSNSVRDFRLFDPQNGRLAVNAVARSIRQYASLVKLNVPIEAFRVLEVVPQLPHLKCLTLRCDATPETHHDEAAENITALRAELQHWLTPINRPLISLCIGNPKPWHHELIDIVLCSEKPIVQFIVASQQMRVHHAQRAFALMAPNLSLAKLKVFSFGQPSDLPGYIGKPSLLSILSHVGRAQDLRELYLLNTEFLFSDFPPLISALMQNQTLAKLTIMMTPGLRFLENLQSEIGVHFSHLGRQQRDRDFHLKIIVARAGIFDQHMSANYLQPGATSLNQLFEYNGYPNMKVSIILAP
jgi:hypothetical protein